ncbi:MAG: response regulator transcription factor [Gammaproteobacteria bacterium]|nr:response regulator transcription factor [Gammaproteobacteria bacterium]
MAHRVLIIDDDAKLAELLAEFLANYGFTVTHAARPARGLSLLRRGGFDAVILDIMLPEMNGFETCRAIRAFSRVPVLMLTARGDTVDRVVGLEIGADDYLPKPFEPRELAARLQALIRRAHATATPGGFDGDTALTFDGLRLLPAAQKVFLVNHGEEQEVELSAAEFRALLALARRRPAVVSRDVLIEELRGLNTRDAFDRSIDTTVSRVRARLRDPAKSPRFIKTVRGAGYAFIAQPLQSAGE